MDRYIEYLDLALSQAAATQTYWDFYLFVLVAVLGFMATVKLEVIKQLYIRILVALLFVAFTLSNMTGMDKNHETRETLIAIAHSQLSKDKEQIDIKIFREGCNLSNNNNQKIKMLCSALPPERLLSKIFHLSFDTIVVILILFSFKIREKLTNPSKPTPRSGAV